MKLSIPPYSIEIKKEIVDKFHNYTCANADEYAAMFLRCEFQNESPDLVFKTHPISEITKKIVQCFIDEIYLREGSDVYAFLDDIGYTDYERI